MTKTLEDTLIDYAVQWARSAGTLPADLQIVGYNSSEQASTERVIVKAAVGEQLMEGQTPFKATLTFEYHTANRNAEEASDVFARIENALFSPTPTAAQQTYVDATFQWLLVITEEAQNSLSNSSNFRIYSRTIPLQAKLL